MNWKEHYQRLATYTQELERRIQDLGVLFQRIRNEIAETDREDLRERGKTRLMRLTRDVELSVEYVSGPGGLDLYPAGTLIQCGANGHVYLDEEGDGNLYFPKDALEPVELENNDRSVDWNAVIWQG